MHPAVEAKLHLTRISGRAPFILAPASGLRSPPPTTSSTRSFSTPSPGLPRTTKLLKVSPEERISVEEIMKHPWLQDSQVIRRANALMATQLRGSKRLVEELYVEVIPDKRARVGEPVSVFRTSLFVFRTPLSSTVSASP